MRLTDGREVKKVPSERVLEEKKQIVKELADKMQNAASVVFVDYKGITVAEDTKLRTDLRNAGVEYAVVKNTLARFAVNQIGYEGLTPILEGTTALATSSDLVAPAKILSEFAKKNKSFKIKAGFVEGRIIDVDEVNNLAELPSKEVLIAKVLGGFNAPIAGFANVLNGTLRGLVVALNAIKEQAEKAS